MGIENILDSLNKTLDKAITLKDYDIIGRWDVHDKLLQGVEILEQLIESGVIGKDKQATIDEVKEVANTIRPINKPDYYK